MAGVSKNCITCSYVGLGSDLISQIDIPDLPTLRQKRRPHQETNSEKASVDRPKYIFSKNNWTDEKEMALENLLMKQVFLVHCNITIQSKCKDYIQLEIVQRFFIKI